MVLYSKFVYRSHYSGGKNYLKIWYLVAKIWIKLGGSFFDTPCSNYPFTHYKQLFSLYIWVFLLCLYHIGHMWCRGINIATSFCFAPTLNTLFTTAYNLCLELEFRLYGNIRWPLIASIIFAWVIYDPFSRPAFAYSIRY